jgi:hypothetical protein
VRTDLEQPQRIDMRNAAAAGADSIMSMDGMVTGSPLPSLKR